MGISVLLLFFLFLIFLIEQTKNRHLKLKDQTDHNFLSSAIYWHSSSEVCLHPDKRFLVQMQPLLHQKEQILVVILQGREKVAKIKKKHSRGRRKREFTDFSDGSLVLSLIYFALKEPVPLGKAWNDGYI